MMPQVDLQDPRQNEFVQNYLSATLADIRKSGEITTDGVLDYEHIEATIELLQETYRPTLYSTSTYYHMYCELERIHKAIGTTPIGDSIEKTAAFIKSVARHSGEGWAQ